MRKLSPGRTSNGQNWRASELRISDSPFFFNTRQALFDLVPLPSIAVFLPLPVICTTVDHFHLVFPNCRIFPNVKNLLFQSSLLETCWPYLLLKLERYGPSESHISCPLFVTHPEFLFVDGRWMPFMGSEPLLLTRAYCLPLTFTMCAVRGHCASLSPQY